jgi:hypothetical protein
MSAQTRPRLAGAVLKNILPSARLARALWLTFALHGIAMVAMAVLLLPGLPGGDTHADTARVAYIGGHPWLWRLGWLPWQLTAASDLLLALALLREPAVARIPAILTSLVTVAAFVPDQWSQACWITTGIHLARRRPAEYLAYEARVFNWTAAWGATLYVVAALGWTWCLAGARLWNRRLTLLSAILWPLFLAASLGTTIGLDRRLIAAGSALGFVLLELWFALVLERVLRRAQPDAEYGRRALWPFGICGSPSVVRRHPGRDSCARGGRGARIATRLNVEVPPRSRAAAGVRLEPVAADEYDATHGNC